MYRGYVMIMKKINRALFMNILLAILCLAFVCMYGCEFTIKDGKNNTELQSAGDSEDNDLGGVKNEVQDGNSVTITFVGDITMHKRQIEKYYTGDGSFDISKGLEYVSSYLEDSDYTVGNLETTLAGLGNGPHMDAMGYSGFPNFNSPDDLAYTLKDAGFDMLQTANNHCMDTGLSGLMRTIDILDDAGLKHVGTSRDQNECDSRCIVDIGGIKFGFVAYTSEINSNSYVEGKPYLFNSLHSYDEIYVSELYDRVEQFRSDGVDIVIALMHWGNEYEEIPDDKQRSLAKGLFEHGVDVIVGGHPHEAQPVECQVVGNGQGQKRKCYVFYSLGDFLSDAVYDDDGVNKDIGLIAKVTFARRESTDGKSCEVTDVSLIPTHIYENENTVGVVAVPDALEKRESGDNTYDFLSDKDWERIEYAQKNINLEIQ